MRPKPPLATNHIRGKDVSIYGLSPVALGKKVREYSDLFMVYTSIDIEDNLKQSLFSLANSCS